MAQDPAPETAPEAGAPFLEGGWQELLRRLGEMWRGFVALLPNLVIALLVVLAAWLLSWSLQKVFWRTVGRRKRLRRSLKDLFAKTIAVAVWVTAVMVAAMVLFPSLTPASVLAGLGLGSIAIGFAFKDIVENFFAGIIILMREPMEIDDYISIEGIEGRVEQITIRDTLLRQTDGERVIIPNGMLFKTPVRILTDLKLRRISILCGVAYGEDVDAARAVIQKAVEDLDTIDKIKGVHVFAKQFGESSVDFEITWWTGSTPFEERRSRDQVVAAVKRGLNEAGIEIPFPYRTLTWKQPLDVRRTELEEQPKESPPAQSSP